MNVLQVATHLQQGISAYMYDVVNLHIHGCTVLCGAGSYVHRVHTVPYVLQYRTYPPQDHQKNKLFVVWGTVLAGAWAKTIPHNSQKVLYRNSNKT